ncbi:hypothetical protein IQ264_16835 [Phormidium sp. LEGE 05292]|uniref:hypothetical protein n=1 Tax=[Phormidium] sp. LEGE 05292 TaxID=767427 RepID=UPI00187F7647|nr:hypothetical protein [Phormidium sp. LEGE 05292]MBE9227096.1 hypothetical protein [Phormidium sp. LEGE 05292]
MRGQNLATKGIFLFFLCSFCFLTSVLLENSSANSQNYVCPADLETLTNLLLRDLPSYANRVTSRSNPINSPSGTYVILAGKPEFAPLTLGPGVYSPAAPVEGEGVPKQIFFTTLERQYLANRANLLQNYHWLFLVKSNSGWRSVMLYSQLGSYPSANPPTAPRESSTGIIGQSVQIWLRDCRAGVIKP